ncbi:MAG: glycine cleavage system aminomethyltransferase GcvT [bacterium]
MSEPLALKQTPLFSLHRELGARMVPFAGYEMPVQYPLGIKKEHLHTRASAGLFDVSHMGQVVISGDGVAAALESLIPVDLQSLANGHAVYGLLLNESGGVRDDLIITRWAEDRFFLVINAGCKDDDLVYLRDKLSGFDIDYREDRALLALQGPLARSVLGEMLPEISDLCFMQSKMVRLNDSDCHLSCSGYTGEDGFELSLPADMAESIARKLLEDDRVEPIGLGARDSLRLEAGLCLYGHELDQTTTPVEAALMWSISPARRAGGARAGGFPGADRIFAQQQSGALRKRVGLRVNGRAPVREGADLQNSQGDAVGHVVSGGFGPSVDAPIAMGYVETQCADIGQELLAIVRGKPVPVTVSKTPFVSQRYFRG